MTRRHWILGAAAMAQGRDGAPASTDRAIGKGLAWLLAQQSSDGGWHSRTYGLLRSGQSLTALIFDTLAMLGGRLDSRGDAALAEAAGFIRRHLNGEGGLGLADDVADYPTYATALALRGATRQKSTLFDTSRMISWLENRQFAEHSGWTRADAAYGGWGIGADVLPAPHPGHVDLSMTRFAIEALAAAGRTASSRVFERARTFLARCQNPDGGFFFSPVVTGANKAGDEGASFRSYGSSTADAILALRASGGDPTRALAWLQRHGQPVLPAGLEAPARQRYARGLRFYYAEAASQIQRTTDWRTPLLNEQRRDGSWINPEPLVKEDDPLIATALAIRALAAA